MHEPTHNSHRGRTIATAILIVGLTSGLVVLGWYYHALSAQTAALENQYRTLTQTLATTSAQLSLATTTIAQLEAEIVDLEEDKDDLRDDLRDERNRNEDFEDQIESIAGTVGTLDKLSKTDEELLQKYSKVYFLNENYFPSDLDEIEQKYVLPSRDEQYFHGDAMRFLEELLDDAADEGLDLYVISAFRSFDEQSVLKGQYTQTYGSGANTFSADQGYSEHQLGTAVDFSTPELDGAVTAFADTPEYAWLLENAHEYGFTLSYPEDNQFYVFEPWHWRFVGTDLARDLERADAGFYDWEQRRIDEYLVSIFD